MISVEPVDSADGDEIDACGNTAVAKIVISNIQIYLCQECVDELTKELTSFNNTIFCHKCKHFIPNEYGWNYDGSCTKSGPVDKESVGYVNSTYSMNTCEDAELKKEVCD